MTNPLSLETKGGCTPGSNPSASDGWIPAFPCTDDLGATRNDAFGLALMDYFAARAMQGICAHPDTWGLADSEIAIHAYRLASEMVKARADAIAQATGA